MLPHAECGCPAGKGPRGDCKHIGTLLYTMADFCERGVLPELLTCTDQLQQWDLPRGLCVDPSPVDQLGTCSELMYTKECYHWLTDDFLSSFFSHFNIG